MTDYQTLKEAVFAIAKEKQLAGYELYYVNSDSTQIGAFDGEVNSFNSSENAAVCFRCVCKDHIGYATTSLFDVSEAASLVERAMENAASIEKEEPIFFCEGGLSYEPVTPKPLSPISTREMGEIAVKTLAECRAADEAVTSGSQTTSIVERETVCIDNSNGVHLEHTSYVGAVVAQVVTNRGAQTGSAYEFELGDLKETDTNKLAQKTVGKALEQMDAEVPESGTYRLVLSPDAMKSLLSVFGQAYSAEQAQHGLSLMAGKEGTVVAASCVTLLDNPFYEKNLNPCPFDAEGTPTRCKAVIEKGVLVTLLHNMTTADKAGVASTGNASKGSVTSPISVSPKLLYFEPGTQSEEELIAQAGTGIYVEDVQGLHAGANFITGDFSLQSNGFLIENGKKGKAVKSFTIAGNFYELLKKVEAVGNEVKTGLSVYASPCVLVSEIVVAGK